MRPHPQTRESHWHSMARNRRLMRRKRNPRVSSRKHACMAAAEYFSRTMLRPMHLEEACANGGLEERRCTHAGGTFRFSSSPPLTHTADWENNEAVSRTRLGRPQRPRNAATSTPWRCALSRQPRFPLTRKATRYPTKSRTLLSLGNGVISVSAPLRQPATLCVCVFFFFLCVCCCRCYCFAQSAHWSRDQRVFRHRQQLLLVTCHF